MEIAKNVYYVGVKDWDRKYFDELVYLPRGTTYNSCLVIGSEKTAIIDTVDPEFGEELLSNIDRTGVKNVDYLITIHAEQDHSGSIPLLLERFPEAMVVTNSKCKSMLMDLLHIDDGKFITVSDGDTLSLGDKTLEFRFAPWVHWPETMFAFLKEDRILFTSDFLGSHIASDGIFFEDYASAELYAKRYYWEIMMPFAHIIDKYLKMIESMNPKVIAPSHGLLYDNPSFIINLYRQWIDPKKNDKVIILYISMHGSTKVMANYLFNKLDAMGIPVKLINAAGVEPGEFAMDLIDAGALIIGTPAVLGGPHPIAVNLSYLANMLRPKIKYAGVFGSYGWGAKIAESIQGLLATVRPEFFEPVIVKGNPSEKDFQRLDEMAMEIEKKLKRGET